MNTQVRGITWLLCLMLLGVMGCPHELQVRRHTATPLTAGEADRILKDATSVIKTNNGPGDKACKVKMKRKGEITTFAAPQFINTQTQMQNAQKLPGNIKVVEQINWCGGFSPFIIGCAEPGNSLVVVRINPALEGILWLHEFGHNKGLEHRNDDNAVMAPSIGATRTYVNDAECDAYKVE